MRAGVVERYGPPEVITVRELPRPEPAADQVLVRVEAAAVTSADARIRAARFPRGFGLPGRLAFGLSGPRRPILGSALSGTVAAVGPGVTDLTLGDRVAGMAGLTMGAHAEYAAVDRRRLVTVPQQTSDDEAAGVLFGGTTALYYLQSRARLRAGQRVLVIGGSGAVGSNAIQLAAGIGAQVTAISGPGNLALLRELGAEAALDHSTGALDRIEDRFDVVLDTVGVLDARSGRRLLTPTGVLQLAVADLWGTITARGRVHAGSGPEDPADFRTLLDQVADGRLRVVIERRVGLDGLAEAHRRIDSGHKVGNIVLNP